MPHHDHNDTEHLKRLILPFEDDLSLPWKSYPCILWDRRSYWDGYGRIKLRVGNKWTTRRAHRQAWELIFGEIPKDQLSCHRCDTPLCIRPSHLFLGNNSANMRDCVAKGRHVGNKKLTPLQVLEIRSRYIFRVTSQYDMAKEYGVTQSVISNVINRKVWMHI